MARLSGPGLKIVGISTFLPSGTLTSEEAAAATGLPVETRVEKLGIRYVRTASPSESTSDLAAGAVKALLQRDKIDPESIEFLLLVTQNPDFKLPTTACLVQHKAGLPQGILAYDINQGCSGFVVALAQADAFLRAGHYRRGIIVTSELYNRVISPQDKDTYGLFGDAASAVLVERSASAEEGVQAFFFGTEGAGAQHLIVKTGGATHPQACQGRDDFLYMNGRAIFNFVTQTLPGQIRSFVEGLGLKTADIDHWIFHQANRYMNGRLGELLGISSERAFFDITDIGNTVSCSIPIALERATKAKAIHGRDVVLCGFGVGLSWGACLYRMPAEELKGS